MIIYVEWISEEKFLASTSSNDFIVFQLNNDVFEKCKTYSHLTADYFFSGDWVLWEDNISIQLEHLRTNEKIFLEKNSYVSFDTEVSFDQCQRLPSQNQRIADSLIDNTWEDDYYAAFLQRIHKFSVFKQFLLLIKGQFLTFYDMKNKKRFLLMTAEVLIQIKSHEDQIYLFSEDSIQIFAVESELDQAKVIRKYNVQQLSKFWERSVILKERVFLVKNTLEELLFVKLI